MFRPLLVRPLLVLLLLVTAVAAARPEEATPRPAVARTARATATGAGAVDPLRDALDRLAPVLGDSPDADAVRSALRTVALQRAVGPGDDASGAGRALHAALDRLERRDPTRGPEIDAIRGALAPAPDGRPAVGR